MWLKFCEFLLKIDVYFLRIVEFLGDFWQIIEILKILAKNCCCFCYPEKTTCFFAFWKKSEDFLPINYVIFAFLPKINVVLHF
jgi:hypothetical protein